VLKNKKALAIVLGFVVLAALLIGCAAGEEKATPTAAAQTPGVGTPTAAATKAEPKRGGTLNVYMGDPSVLDPQRGTTSNAHYNVVGLWLTGPTYGPGTEYTDSTPGPQLAESWEMSADGRIYTFHLRQGVKWQDKPPVNGREVVASDVKFTFDRIFRVAKNMYGMFLGSVTSIEAPDKYTVVFTLDEPFFDFLENTGNFWTVIIPPECEEKIPGGFSNVEATIGAGPFTLESYQPNVKAVFKRNPTYFRSPMPYLDGIQGINIADSSTRQAALRAGNLDISSVDAVNLELFKRTNPELQMREELPSAGWAIAMRTDKPPFNDVRVRQAIALALNRQEWVDTIYMGHGVVDNGVLNAAMTRWKLPTDQLGEGAKYYRYDPQESKRLLAEAGYTNGFETTFTVSGGVGTATMEGCELIVDYLSRVDIKVTLKPMETGAWLSSVASGGKYEGMAYSGEWVTPCAGLKIVGWYGPTQLTNISHVNDPKMNEMMEKSAKCVTFECRKEVVDEFQRYDSVMLYRITLPTGNGITLWQPWVKDYQSKAYGWSGQVYQYIWLDK